MNDVWFTSDQHFGHRNIIQYCNRPFKDTEEMDETIINNWNSVVKMGDIVWVLGDFSLVRDKKPTPYLEKIFNRLSGQKNLICGNHDRECVRGLKWNVVDKLKTVKIHDSIFVLCHFPLLTWDRERHGSIMAHGHCHSLWQSIDPTLKRFDVGVDGNNFTPISSEQIKSKFGA